MNAPNTEYLELTFVKETATGQGLNQKMIMTNLHNGFFHVEEGRFGIRINPRGNKKFDRPIEEWDSFFNERIAKGYILYSDHKTEKKEVKKTGVSFNGKNYSPIPIIGVAEIVRRLIEYTQQYLDNSYTIKVEDISDEMLERGRLILDELADNYEKMSIAEFNGKLKLLFCTIPRRMDNLSKHLAKRKTEFRDIVAHEQELFDVMYTQIKQTKVTGPSNDKTVLEAFNLDWDEVTPEEEKMLKKLMGGNAHCYRKAWKINNRKTRQKFDDYCKEQNFAKDEIHMLFHGSRNENFWSIITNGLTINPKNVVVTGKMFGNGTYFADDADKSMGYTSTYGSRWANGSNSSGFLAVYSVATGVQYHPKCSDGSLTWKRLQSLCPGAHCTWARRQDTGLRKDEIIVYQDMQSTIEYLIEVAY